MSEENLNQNDSNETPEQKADKETKKYLAVLDVVKAVVGGEQNLRPKKKVKGDVAAELVAELFKEEKEELRRKVKDGLKNLLKQHVQLEADIKVKEDELKKVQLEKRKEFTKSANAWLQQVDRAEIMNSTYAEALETAFKKQEDEEKK